MFDEAKPLGEKGLYWLKVDEGSHRITKHVCICITCMRMHQLVCLFGDCGLLPLAPGRLFVLVVVVKPLACSLW